MLLGKLRVHKIIVGTAPRVTAARVWLHELMKRHRAFVAAGATAAGLACGSFWCDGRLPSLSERRATGETIHANSDTAASMSKALGPHRVELFLTAPSETSRLAKTVSEALGLPHGSSLHPAPKPFAADALLAGIGLGCGIATLGLLEKLLGLRLFAPPMMASGIIFFAGQTPPNPKGFLAGTFCSATLSFGTLALLTPRLPPVAAQGAAAGVLLTFYKATGAIFPPAAVLAGALTTAAMTTAAPAAASLIAASSTTMSIGSAASYLAMPWLAGHALLYGFACALSEVRWRVRVRLTQRELLSLHDQSDDALRTLFRRFDTSGDGALDADELKVALRGALGVDLSQSDCARLVAAADKDGTETLDFEEFCAICKGML